MRNLALAVLVFGLSGPAFALNMDGIKPSDNYEVGQLPMYTALSQCVIASENDFRSAVAPLRPIILKATDEAKEKIISYINEQRAKNKEFALEADKLLIGVFVNDGQLMVGVVMFKDGCVVPGTASSVPAENFADFLTKLGLDFNKDFVKDPGIEAVGV